MRLFLFIRFNLNSRSPVKERSTKIRLNHKTADPILLLVVHIPFSPQRVEMQQLRDIGSHSNQGMQTLCSVHIPMIQTPVYGLWALIQTIQANTRQYLQLMRAAGAAAAAITPVVNNGAAAIAPPAIQSIRPEQLVECRSRRRQSADFTQPITILSATMRSVSCRRETLWPL